MTQINEHGQPDIAINFSRNKRKALQDLWGICHGIVADQRINADEAVFLYTWLRNNRILRSDPDYQDILELTTDILEDNIVTHEEQEDLLQLIQDLLAVRVDSAGFANDTDAMQRLLGICKGLVADYRVNQMEIIALTDWLEQFREWTDNPIADDLRSLIANILQDGIVTSQEKESLLQILQSVAGYDLQLGVTGGLSINLYNDDVQIIFPDKYFCFTGQFLFGVREDCHKATKDRGGNVQKSITQQTDYIVIGELSSRDWAHTSFGRKIQKAVEYRNKGVPVSIVQESLWVQGLT